MAEPRAGTSPEGGRASWQGRTYLGLAGEDPATAVRVADDAGVVGVLPFVDQREHARVHYGEDVVASPPAFTWGYEGSGPADTAASLLADHFGRPQPRSVVQRFKREVVARFGQHAGWTLTSSEVAAWAEANQAVMARAWAEAFAEADMQAALARGEDPGV